MLAKDKIIKARAALILDQPFFGALSLKLLIEETPDAWFNQNGLPATMATNGVKIIYSSKWVDKLSMDEIKTVICHEVMHLALGHHCRRQQREPRKWNVAGDHVVNLQLMAAKDPQGKSLFTMPKEGLCDPQFTDMFTEQVYSLLPDSQQGQGKGKGGDGPSMGEVMDYPGESGTGQATQSELQQQEIDWKIAATQAAQAAKMCGKLPSSLARFVEDLNEARVNWREALQRFVNQCARNDYTWKRPNGRYFSQGIILPSLYSEQLPPIVVAVDTSGSISAQDLAQFAGEIDEIIGQYNATVTVLYCDARINGEETFTPENRPVRLQAKGGGGTDFAPVMERVIDLDDAACLVYLTDMCCGSFGQDPGIPVLWIATEGKHHQVPFGEVVYL